MLPKFLKPHDVKLSNLIRIGPKTDGGYVLDKRIINKTKILITCGLNDDWEFEKSFLQKNLSKIKKFLKKLDLKIIHIHANNYGGVDKHNNPKVIELSLINTRKIKIKNIFSKRKYPIINLDYKNFKRRDDIKIEFNE